MEGWILKLTAVESKDRVCMNHSHYNQNNLQLYLSLQAPLTYAHLSNTDSANSSLGPNEMSICSLWTKPVWKHWKGLLYSRQQTLDLCPRGKSIHIPYRTNLFTKEKLVAVCGNFGPNQYTHTFLLILEVRVYCTCVMRPDQLFYYADVDSECNICYHYSSSRFPASTLKASTFPP